MRNINKKIYFLIVIAIILLISLGIHSVTTYKSKATEKNEEREEMAVVEDNIVQQNNTDTIVQDKLE